MEPVTAHIEDATVHMSTITAHTVYGTIKLLFKPTATADVKMAKPFIKTTVSETG